jgi:hypothetical protein
MISTKYVLLYMAGPLVCLVLVARDSERQEGLITGTAAFGDYRQEQPGVRRRITVADLPPPFATSSASLPSQLILYNAGLCLK